jgi:hypothetical protein
MASPTVTARLPDRLYERAMLIRAQAAPLLKLRGHELPIPTGAKLAAPIFRKRCERRLKRKLAIGVVIA